MDRTEMEKLLNKSNPPPIRQRRQRTNFNESAVDVLEESFALNPYPDINERETLARRLETSEDRIQVWFQNKRARYRKKMTKRDENGRIKSAIKIQEEKSLEASSPEPRTELKYLESSSSTPEAASRLGKSSIMDDSGYKSSILADITTCVGNHYQAQVSFSASHSNLAYRGYAFNSPQLNSSSSSPSTVISSFVPAYYGDSSTPYTRFYATDSVSSYWSSPASFEPSLGHAYSTPRLATTSTKRTAIFRPYE